MPCDAQAKARSLLADLTERQKEAVESDVRRLLIVAGAGSGKTEVVARRIAWYVGVRAVPKDRIVAFTFTERAAEELQFRVRQHLARVAGHDDGGDPTLGGMFVGTIHSYCLKRLRELKPDVFHNFDVLDEGGRYALVERYWYQTLAGKPLEQAFADANIAKGHFDSVGRFLHAYDLLNEYHRLEVDLGSGTAPDPGSDESGWCAQATLGTEVGQGDAAKAFADTAARYYALLRCRRFLDFSTAQAELLRQVEDDDEACAALRVRVGHLVVDEVQDINPVQARLVELLVDDEAGLTAVGDHRQAIFGWRGGRVEIMGDLHDELAAADDGSVIVLRDNFRSTPRVIELSNRWAKTINVPRGMRAVDMIHGRGRRTDHSPRHVAFVGFEERESEASWIAATIDSMVDGQEGAAHDTDEGERGLRYADVAILLRNAKKAQVYADALRERGIPVIFRGSDLFAQPEVLLMLGALGRVAGVEKFKSRSLEEFIRESLDCEPVTEELVRKAAAKLKERRLPVGADLADRMLRLADLLHDHFYDEKPPEARELEGLRSSAALPMLKSRSRRRLFPQAIYHALLEEAGVADIDALGTAGETVMFHLGALSRLVTSAETPGWTTKYDFKSQVIGLSAWGPQRYRLPEADLLAAADAVSIGTIHSAKGLQWPAVFVADVCAQRFPSQRAKTPPKLPFEGDLAEEIDAARLADNDNNDDERRLMYVALSRAERYLFATCSGSRSSRFRKELEPLIRDVGGVEEAKPGEVPGELRMAPGARDPGAQRIVSSFSDLRYYLECPHDFYLRKILGFSPTIDQTFGYGRGVHNVLRAIHTDPGRWSKLAADSAALEAEVRGLIESGLFYLRYTTGDPLHNMREAAVRVVTDYVMTYADELAELTFEPEREFETLLELENVLISGAIDLVRRDDPPRVTLVDFKSGDTEHDNAVKLDSEKMKLQVSLYGIAARAEMEYEPDQALVRYLAETDPERRELKVPLNEAALEKAASTINRVARSIKSRDFHRGPDPAPPGADGPRCNACDFRHFCGVKPS